MHTLSFLTDVLNYTRKLEWVTMQTPEPLAIVRVPTGPGNREKGLEFDKNVQGPWKGLEFDENCQIFVKNWGKWPTCDEKSAFYCCSASFTKHIGKKQLVERRVFYP